MNELSTPTSELWMVRAGSGGVFAEYFLNEGVVTIGWGQVGAIDPTDSDEEVKQRFEQTFPDAKPRTRLAHANQAIKFIKELKVGAVVVTYANQTRTYHIGIIQSPATHGPLIHGSQAPGYSRRVNWKHEVSRDSLSADARNRLGGLSTLFSLPATTSQEFERLCSGKTGPVAPTGSLSPESLESDSEEILTTEDILQDYISKSDQFVEDEIAKLDWQQLQELVAGILRGMGYRTRVARPGSDRGVDIFASADGLGLTEPRIFVEVKHRSGPIGSQDVRSSLGGRRPGDRCLYVSTGGFSQDARYEADRSTVPLTLLTMPDLRRLLLDYYENLDSETRSLVRLKRVYWPVVE